MSTPLSLPLDRRVLAALGELGAAVRVTPDQIAARLSADRVGVLAALTRLEKKRLVRRIGAFDGHRRWGQRGLPGLWEATEVG